MVRLRAGVAGAALLLMGMAAPAKIEGLWLTQDGAGVVEIAPCAGGMCGWLVGFRRQPPPRDYQGISECNLEFIGPMRLGDDGAWHGTIVDPHQGALYRADISSTQSGLRLRGYLGISLFGQTQLWPRFSGQIRQDCSVG